MIDQLTSNNPPKLSAEISTGFNRLQALLQIGETISAQVVSVVAQPPRRLSQPSDARQALQPPPSAPTRGSNQAGATENRAATSPQSQAAPTEYRIRVQVQGQTLELISTKPLPPGSEIQLSRTPDNRVLLQPPAQSTPSPSTAGTAAANPTSPNSGGSVPTPASSSQGSATTATPNATPPANGAPSAAPASASASATTQASAQQQRLAALLPQANQPVTARVVESRPATATGATTAVQLQTRGPSQPVYGDPRISAAVRTAAAPDLTPLLQSGTGRASSTPPPTNTTTGQASSSATPAATSTSAASASTNPAANSTPRVPPLVSGNPTTAANTAATVAQANLAQSLAAQPSTTSTQPASGAASTAASAAPNPTAAPANAASTSGAAAGSTTTAPVTTAATTPAPPQPASGAASTAASATPNPTAAPANTVSTSGAAAGSTTTPPVTTAATTPAPAQPASGIASTAASPTPIPATVPANTVSASGAAAGSTSTAPITTAATTPAPAQPASGIASTAASPTPIPATVPANTVSASGAPAGSTNTAPVATATSAPTPVQPASNAASTAASAPTNPANAPANAASASRSPIGSTSTPVATAVTAPAPTQPASSTASAGVSATPSPTRASGSAAGAPTSPTPAANNSAPAPAQVAAPPRPAPTAATSTRTEATAPSSQATSPSPPAAPSAAATTPAASSNAQTAHRTLLNINGHNLEVTTPKAIPVGTEVKAIRSADGQLTLQLPAPRAAAVNAALLKHLPRQQPPDELFNQLSALSSNAGIRQAQPLLMSLISLLLGRTLARPTEPNPKGVKQQLLNGGTLMENKLAYADRANLAQDQKALLLKLAQQLPQGGARELPSADTERLQQLVQQAVSRVISNQIHSLGSQAGQDREGEATRMLVTDIPVQGQAGRHENVHVHIKEQQVSNTETEQAPPRWQVELSFKIAGLPPMSATLTLEQQQISLVWQGESGTRHLLQPRLGQLQQRLEGLGLEVAVIGVRDRSERRPGSQSGTALIDVET